MSLVEEMMQKGKMEGKKEGKIEGKKEMVFEMLKKNMDVALIIELSKLTEKEVLKLKKELENSK